MREPFGGGVARVRGARLMASGISRAQWNNADVVDESVDVDAVVRWYEPRGVPWGMRVPVEIELDVGEPLFVKRCVALLPGTRGRAGEVRLEDDPRAYAAVEAAAFDYQPSAALEWVGPEFGHPGFRHWVATVEGAPAAIGTTVRTDGDAGPAAYLTGLALLTGAPVAALAALVDTAAADAFASGAAFVHANPSTAEEDEALAAHRPVEVAGLLVRVCLRSG